MRWKPGSVLDLIDSALADCTSDDAMRWRPESPASEWARGGWATEYSEPVTVTLDNSEGRFVATGAGFFEVEHESTLTAMLVKLGAALTELFVEMDLRRARLRRMHTEYSRRTRRRNRRG